MLGLFRRGRWPDFLIIGAQKSGTSALYELLSQHPQVIQRPGEVHFFDVHYHLGVDWYKTQFQGKGGRWRVVGDKSPYYLYHPLVPKRAHSLLPKAKLIVLLRNPIDRAYSQYWMNKRKNQENLSFLDAIKAEKERLAHIEDQIIATGITEPFSSHRLHSYLSRGLYLEQLKRWLAYYPFEQIKISFYEDFRENPKTILNDVLSFLRLPGYDHFNFKVGEVPEYPPMDPEVRQQLEESFYPHNEQLELFLGKKLPWAFSRK